MKSVIPVESEGVKEDDPSLVGSNHFRRLKDNNSIVLRGRLDKEASLGSQSAVR